jgi:hypothetical protein
MPTETEIIRQVSPEEQELASKRRELEGLVALLADRELLLATTKVQLAAFEGLYLREVGVLYAELDEWLAKIAESVAARDDTAETKATASEARRQADETNAALSSEIAKTPQFNPSPELRSLFLEVVRAVHPDRANGEADRFLRERLMKKATDAFARADAETLENIIQEYASSPESVQGVGVAADLLRVVRHIQQIAKRLAEIDQELAGVTASDMAKLRDRYEGLMPQKRNLLAEMASSVQSQIDMAKKQHATVFAGWGRS